MVRFGFEDWSNVSKLGPTPPIHLVIYTNEITKEILDCVDTSKTPNIIFEIPKLTGYRVFDLQVEIYHWKFFASNIESLSFRGVLVENQFTVEHFECMTRLKYLTIGATTYPLFEGENISNLPLVRKFISSGYGMVIKSESLEKWERKLKLNAAASGTSANDYYLH